MASEVPTPYPIVGIDLPPDIPRGQVPLRQDVELLYAAEDDDSQMQVKLMLLAMVEFEKTPVTDRLSYFQIAGQFMHCVPCSSSHLPS